MESIRASKIADQFSGNMNFVVRSYCGGVMVHHLQRTHYFVRESCFWSYVYRVAGLPFRE